MTKVNWSGVLPALATPFTADGDVDRPALQQLVELLIAEGASGLVVGGSTGEYYSMTVDERAELFQSVAKIASGRITMIAGTSSINHKETILLTELAKQEGFDGVMILPPVYCLPTQPEVVKSFRDLDSVGIPIMIYNNPARVGVALTTETVANISEMQNVVAYKESSRDIYLISELYYATRDKLSHFAGLEPYASALLSRGAKGIVSTISNVCARQVVDYYSAFKNSDIKEMSRNQQVIDQLYHLLARSKLSSFSFVKCAMKALGRPGGHVRAPHQMASDDQIRQIGVEIKKIYERAGVQMK